MNGGTTDYRDIEQRLSVTLGLASRPVAISFRDTVPPDVPKFIGTEPSGCSFWRLAAQGRTFYTVPSDHYNCSIGSHTHNIALPPERAHELEQMLGLMTSMGYLRMEEVPAIPRLPKTPSAIVYSPLGDAPVDPDVVILWGRPAGMMLVHEATIRAGMSSQLDMLPRPTCMALPAALTSAVVASTACVGNRVYTDIEDTDLYVAIRGKDLTRVVAEAQTVATANAKLRQYHRDRRHTLATE